MPTVTVANAELNALLRATAYTGPASLFLSIHTDDPFNDGSNEYVGYSGGLRPAVTFNAAADGRATNAVDCSYSAMGATTIRYVGLWTANTGGTFVDTINVSPPLTTASGDLLRFSAGQVTWGAG